ncbi:solute carrier 26 family protein [Balneolaceae bacterium YR4-1]|uniref:Solute carrier 26 family protein n=1 Tax=Halalkalibaculum roseum TaxID=2709311 RepID=A0A6M1SXZ0_9BACT|nr:solute carrier family 26 protein [Halalkalibaculum roseum]NGP77960.1 solute carrier 26 family protein [Halalkalibaculum roseum]
MSKDNKKKKYSAENKSLLKRHIPISDWLPEYHLPDLKKDFRAGLTVGVLLIPQSMAYAIIAGLPAIYGLYASIIPLAIYAVFGTSRQLAIGPVAIISLLVATGVGSVAEAGTQEYISLAITLAFFVGITQILMGAFRLGFLMNFISSPVLSGFTSAAAFIIGASQLENLLGMDLPQSKYIYRTLSEVFSNWQEIHLLTFSVGMGAILIIWVMKKWKPSFPIQLVTVLAAIAGVWYFNLEESGVAIVGSVSEGFPKPIIPDILDFPFGPNFPFGPMAPTILAVAFLGFTQSIALAKTMVKRNPNYKVDSNQELYSLGLANMIGSLFQAYPVAGSFSRTIVNDENRAKTSISLVVSALLVTLTVLFLTPLIYYLPKTVLAAIILTAVPGLIDWEEVTFLWKVRRRELALLILTFVSTLAFGILEGIGIGVILSLIIVIYNSSHPNIVMLGRIPETDKYRDLERYPDAKTQSNTIIVRIDSTLYFANIEFMKEKLEELEIVSEKNLEQVIIDANGINEVDSSALHALRELIDEYHNRDIDVIFANVKGPVRDLFQRSGLVELLGEENFYLDINKAVSNLEEEVEVPSHLK